MYWYRYRQVAGVRWCEQPTQGITTCSLNFSRHVLRGNWLHNFITGHRHAAAIFTVPSKPLLVSFKRWTDEEGNTPDLDVTPISDCAMTDLLNQHCWSNEVHGKGPNPFLRRMNPKLKIFWIKGRDRLTYISISRQNSKDVLSIKILICLRLCD